MNTLQDSIKDAQNDHWHWTKVIKEYSGQTLPELSKRYLDGEITTSDLQDTAIQFVQAINMLIRAEHLMYELESRIRG